MYVACNVSVTSLSAGYFPCIYVRTETKCLVLRAFEINHSLKHSVVSMRSASVDSARFIENVSTVRRLEEILLIAC